MLILIHVSWKKKSVIVINYDTNRKEIILYRCDKSIALLVERNIAHDRNNFQNFLKTVKKK